MHSDIFHSVVALDDESDLSCLTPQIVRVKGEVFKQLYVSKFHDMYRMSISDESEERASFDRRRGQRPSHIEIPLEHLMAPCRKSCPGACCP